MRNTGQMRNKAFYALALVCSLFAGACKSPLRSKAEVAAFIDAPANHLSETKIIGDLNIKASYLPLQLLWGADTTGAAFKDKLIFCISYSAKGKALLRQLPFDQYSFLVRVFSFQMKDFIELQVDGKAVKPIECLFQPTYGLGRQDQVIAIFDRKRLGDADLLRLVSREFGLGVGDLTFDFDKGNMTSLDKSLANLNLAQQKHKL